MFGQARRNRMILSGQPDGMLYLPSGVIQESLDKAHRIAAALGAGIGEKFTPLVEYVLDFSGFCRDVLGVKLWAGQEHIGNLVRDNPRVSVAACYASGKTFTAACLALWWLFTRRPAMVITTAPTGRQVKTLLWRDIRKLFKRSRRKFPGRLLQTRIDISDDWFAMGFSSDAPNSVAGLHEKNTLFIEDEAAGMKVEIVEGFEGITAGEGSRHLKIGNPVATDGPFFDSHMHEEERSRWATFSIDAEETPNVQAGYDVIPGLVSREWVDDKRHRWLERGIMALWETRVKGRFYLTAAEKLIPDEWIRLAAIRWDDANLVGIRRLGADIAGGGRDETVITLREGQRLRVVDTLRTDDLMAQARRIADLAIEHNVTEIVIDSTGLGQGVWSKLEELQRDGYLPGTIHIERLRLNLQAIDRDTFATRQDEVLWSLREAMDPNGREPVAIDPRDKELIEELGWRSWTKENSSSQRISVEGKKRLKLRGKRSPDRMDSHSCCTARTSARVVPLQFL